jgi:hypothetical protein
VTGFPEFPNTHNKLADRYHLSPPLPNYFFDPLPCVIRKHTSKIYLYRILGQGRAFPFLKKWFLYFFLFLHYKNIILYSIFKFYTCLDKFNIFNNYVSLKQCLRYTSNLNWKCIK